MAIRARDIYQGRRKKMHSPARIIALVLLVTVVILTSLFYLLRSMCEYDSEGNATIVFPFSQSKDEKPDEVQKDGEK